MINIKCLLLGHIWRKVPYAFQDKDGRIYCHCLRCGRLSKR